MEYADYLVHHGILGMHWGIRRFQNRDGSLTAAGKKRAVGGDKTGNARHKPSSAKKLAKQRAAALEKARQAKAAKKEYETNKQNALKKGSAQDVLKFKGDLTNKELQDAYTRLNTEQLLSTIASREVKTAWDQFDNVANKLAKLTDYADKGTKAWNTFAKISNSFSETQLPIIGEKNKTAEDSRVSKILKSGTAEEVLKLVQEGKTTKAQREEAINRFNSEDILKKIAQGNNTPNNQTGNNAPKNNTPNNQTGNNTPKNNTPNNQTGNNTPKNNTSNNQTGNNAPKNNTPNNQTGNNTPKNNTSNNQTGNNTPKNNTPNNQTGNNAPKNNTPNNQTGNNTPKNNTPNNQTGNNAPKNNTPNNQTGNNTPKNNAGNNTSKNNSGSNASGNNTQTASNITGSSMSSVDKQKAMRSYYEMFKYVH